jgi:prepilin-type N-terminal cleavage/methylation domain-containing protein
VSTRGFSLIEVLVAVAVLTTTLTGVARLVSVAAGANRAARSLTLATLLAQDRMERLMSDRLLATSVSGSTAWNVPGYHDVVDAAGHAALTSDAPAGMPLFFRRWSTEVVAGDAGLVKLDVLVWPLQREMGGVGTVHLQAIVPVAPGDAP